MTHTALLQRLLLIEKALTASIKERQAVVNELPSAGELEELKSVLDRMRPLLWIYLARRNGHPTLHSDNNPFVTEQLSR